MANILAQGDMTGFRFLSAKEVAELKSDYLSKSDVVWMAEDARIDQRRCIGICAGQGDAATALGPKLANANRESMIDAFVGRWISERNDEMGLPFRQRRIFVRSPEGTSFAMSKTAVFA